MTNRVDITPSEGYRRAVVIVVCHVARVDHRLASPPSSAMATGLRPLWAHQIMLLDVASPEYEATAIGAFHLLIGALGVDVVTHAASLNQGFAAQGAR